MHRIVIARTLALLALACLHPAHAAEPSPLQPFQADYQVLRNGKELGQATLALRDTGHGAWEFSSQTRGTKGMASLLGVDVVEKSTFRWHGGVPEGLQYTYAQKAAIKSRQRSTDFDWNAKQARTRDGDSESTAPLQGSAMDRNLVTLALMARLKAGASDLTFRVVDKDHVAEQHYVAGARESLSLPAGRIDSVRVDRQRDDSKRTTTIWFAPQRNWLPVQIEQVEKNGETITMRLASPRQG
ncbi:MAG TPA: DUF3108 domain-containing protein [Rudaea sp.]